MSEISIPQRLWEDYVQFRDRMTELEKLVPTEDSEDEFHKLAQKVYEIERGYDKEYLEIRYEDSLKPKN